MRPVFVAVAGLVLAGCGTATSTHGTARLWVTRDRGAHVLLTTTVPAGLTAMEALRKKAKIELRYGGRYVQAINGIEGSLSDRRDWFYFINGYEGDRSAAEYRLHPGDVEWWDYRSWAKEMRAPIVVGAFPEPFLHGYAGKRRAAVVVSSDPEAKRRLGKLIGARSGGDPNVLQVEAGTPTRLEADGGASPGDPVRVRFVGDWRLLLRQPFPFRYRYEVESSLQNEALCRRGALGRRDAASSVASVFPQYERSLRPCLAPSIAPRTTRPHPETSSPQ